MVDLYGSGVSSVLALVSFAAFSACSTVLAQQSMLCSFCPEGLHEEYQVVWVVRKEWLALVFSWQRWMNVLCRTMVGVSSTVRTHWAVTNAPVSLAMSWQLIKRAVKVRSNLQIEPSDCSIGTTAKNGIKQSWKWFSLPLHLLYFIVCLFVCLLTSSIEKQVLVKKNPENILIYTARHA